MTSGWSVLLKFLLLELNGFFFFFFLNVHLCEATSLVNSCQFRSVNRNGTELK